MNEKEKRLQKMNKYFISFVIAFLLVAVFVKGINITDIDALSTFYVSYITNPINMLLIFGAIFLANKICD